MEDDAALALGAKTSALEIIGAEHAAFDAALAAIVEHLAMVRAHRVQPDANHFERGLTYLATFMDRFHHPKEDEHLFRAIRERTAEADDTLALLQIDHAQSAGAYRDLQKALAGSRQGASGQFDDFGDLMERYARAQLEHMRIESQELVPLAERALRLSAWPAIDAAFRAGRDPLFGSAAGMGLFSVRLPRS